MPMIYTATVHYTAMVCEENDDKYWFHRDQVIIKYENDDIDNEEVEEAAKVLIKKILQKHHHGPKCEIWSLDVDVIDIEHC